MDKQLLAIVDSPEAKSQQLKLDMFDTVIVSDPRELEQHPRRDEIELAIIEFPKLSDPASEPLLASKSYFSDMEIPVVAMMEQASLEQKIQILESGYQDIISHRDSREELNTRILAQIFHRVANEQLKQNLDQANIAAFSAMNESSNLGNNIQFLLNIHQCANLDELGLVFFQTINDYDINCSLQMRSCFGAKNMEANGMERQLESELLNQLKDTGRYYDFGSRSVCNYGCVSVLIKNMPEDELRYGIIKDNTFTLLQGLDARVRALDEHSKLEQEKDALKQLSHGITHAMTGLEMEYHGVMNSIITAVEDMSDKIESGISTLLLSEDQENFLENAVSGCVDEATTIFNEGLKIDTHLKGLEEKIKQVLAAAEEQSSPPPIPIPTDVSSNCDVELF